MQLSRREGGAVVQLCRLQAQPCLRLQDPLVAQCLCLYLAVGLEVDAARVDDRVGIQRQRAFRHDLGGVLVVEQSVCGHRTPTRAHLQLAVVGQGVGMDSELLCLRLAAVANIAGFDGQAALGQDFSVLLQLLDTNVHMARCGERSRVLQHIGPDVQGARVGTDLPRIHDALGLHGVGALCIQRAPASVVEHAPGLHFEPTALCGDQSGVDDVLVAFEFNLQSLGAATVLDALRLQPHVLDADDLPALLQASRLQLGSLIGLQLAAVDQGPIGLDADLPRAEQPSIDPHAHALACGHQSDLVGIHAAELPHVQARRVGCVGRAGLCGDLRCAVVKKMGARDRTQLLRVDLTLNIDIPRKQVHLAVGGLQAIGTDLDLPRLHIQSSQAAVGRQFWPTGGEGGAIGVDEPATVASDAALVGHHHIGLSAGHFQVAL